MKVALLADIQGNLLALETTLADCDRRGVDTLICLGDVASGPYPVECLARLRERQCQMVMGNMDLALLYPPSDEPLTSEEAKRYAEIDAWCVTQLTAEDRAFLASFQPTIQLDVEGTHLLCFHGSPHATEDVIVATTPDSELVQLLAGQTADIMAMGHMHEPMLRRWRQHLLLTPGSVGLPPYRTMSGDKDGFALRTEYAIVTLGHAINIEFVAQPIDPNQFQQSLVASGMPHSIWFFEQWH